MAATVTVDEDGLFNQHIEQNTEIVSFHVNVLCWFANSTRHIGIIPSHC